MEREDGKRYKLGEVYMMNFSGEENEQRGWRPGIVFQNNKGNKHSPNIVAIPLTTSLKKIGQPTHVFLPSEETGLKKNSIALCENVTCMSKSRIGDYLTTLPDEYIADVAAANILASSAISFLDFSRLMSLHKRATFLNKDDKIRMA